MLRSQPRAVRILGRKALSTSKAAPLDGDGLRSSRAYYAVVGPYPSCTARRTRRPL